jgi:hypothetical protein
MSPYIISALIAAAATVGGNVLVYYWLKGKLDKKITTFQIAYSGVFREKIDIYRELLNKAYSLRLKLTNFNLSPHTEHRELKEDIAIAINELYQYCSMNQPFISDSLFQNLRKVTAEYQDMLLSFAVYHSLARQPLVNEEIKKGYERKYQNAVEKIIFDYDLDPVINAIVREMKSDLLGMQ